MSDKSEIWFGWRKKGCDFSSGVVHFVSDDTIFPTIIIKNQCVSGYMAGLSLLYCIRQLIVFEIHEQNDDSYNNETED